MIEAKINDIIMKHIAPKPQYPNSDAQNDLPESKEQHQHETQFYKEVFVLIDERHEIYCNRNRSIFDVS